MSQISFEYCNRCKLKYETDDSLLSELAYNEDRYLADLLKKAQEDTESALHQEAAKYMTERLECNLEEEAEKEKGEMFDGPFESDEWQDLEDLPGLPRQGIDEITEEDLKRALEEYEHKGVIAIEKGKVVVTSKGVRKLAANALERILKNLNQKSSGSHSIEKFDFGVELSLHTRRYEVGDDYAAVNIEQTALNALRRNGELKFEPEDFEIYEEIHQSRLNAAIIIDESGSMRDCNKLEASMETALALSKLIMRDPENSLKVFVFSDEVKQIQPWEIVNQVISGGDTDIKAALAAYRRTCRHEYGDKQVYLITDTEPNNEAGTHLPFEKAANGLIEEASRYRQENIGLNIIMLDDSPELKNLASTLAKKNLGRVFFTSPSELGEVLIEDYLVGRRENISSSI